MIPEPWKRSYRGLKGCFLRPTGLSVLFSMPQQPGGLAEIKKLGAF